jgi:hypothetical protein
MGPSTSGAPPGPGAEPTLSAAEVRLSCSPLAQWHENSSASDLYAEPSLMKVPTRDVILHRKATDRHRD